MEFVKQGGVQIICDDGNTNTGHQYKIGMHIHLLPFLPLKTSKICANYIFKRQGKSRCYGTMDCSKLIVDNYQEIMTTKGSNIAFSIDYNITKVFAKSLEGGAAIEIPR